MIMPRYLSAMRSERDTRKKYVRRERGTRIEEDNMSITRSISIAQIDKSSKSELLCRLVLLLKNGELVGNTNESSVIYEKQDGNMSNTCS